MSLLAASGLHVSFGGVQAARDVNLEVDHGELVGLIGPNGAGKTTLLRLLTGIVSPDRGRVHFDGRDVTSAPVHARARLGLAMTHQIVRPFADMTLVDNVSLAAAHAVTSRPIAALASTDRGAARARARELLARLGIEEMADQQAATLPLGILKRLEMGRALAIGPKLLMLDEPLAGLNHTEAVRLADLIQELNAQGLSIVLIEHNLAEVVRIVTRLVVLDNGSVLASGKAREVMQRPDVRAAYLGPSESSG